MKILFQVIERFFFTHIKNREKIKYAGNLVEFLNTISSLGIVRGYVAPPEFSKVNDKLQISSNDETLVKKNY